MNAKKIFEIFNTQFFIVLVFIHNIIFFKFVANGQPKYLFDSKQTKNNHTIKYPLYIQYTKAKIYKANTSYPFQGMKKAGDGNRTHVSSLEG